MLNQLTKIVAVLTVVALMSACPVVYASSRSDNPQGGDNPQGPNALAPNMSPDEKAAVQARQAQPANPMAGLNLSPEQRSEVMAQSRMAIDPKSLETLKNKTEELDAAIAKPGSTRADVNGLVDELAKIQAQMLSQRVDYLFGMKKILTPEQLKTMMEMNRKPLQRQQQQVQQQQS